MKILLLVPALNLGGVETGTIDLAKSLKKNGEDVIVVSSGGRLVKELYDFGIEHIQLPIHKKSLTILFQIYKLKSIIKNKNIDIVHAQSRMPAWIAYFACKNTQAEFITSCHGYYSKYFFSKVMGWGEVVIVISEAIARHMEEAFGVPKEKIRLVYRGVDISHYQFQPDKYNQTKDKFIIVNIARLTPIKGQEEFIKAMNIVRDKIPHIEAWIIGSADNKKLNYEKKLYRLVKELNLDNTIKFLGSKASIAEVLKDCELLVLSTKVPEAFGRVIIEAGASGVAVCAPDIGGINEIIKDGKDGLLFVCGDENSMAQAIIKMLNNRGLRKQCSNNLRKEIEGKFYLELMVNQTIAVYKEALSNKKILVIKLGGLGDLILITPSLRALHRRFSQAKISLLIDKPFEPLVINCPYIDEIILFDRKEKMFFELLNKLRKKRFDLSIDLKNNTMTHCMAYFTGIPFRYGFNKGISSFLLNYRQNLPGDLVEQPVQQQFRVLEKIGVSAYDNSLELWPTAKEDVFIEEVLNERDIFKKDKVIGFAISASQKWPAKNWPIENFSKLSEMLIQQGVKVVLLGDKFCEEKLNIFPKHINIVSFIGETNLVQLVSLIKRFDVLVTGDSAPMHIAAAVGVKIIALFGPTDPNRHIPQAKSIDVLAKHIECQPCYKRSCINEEKELACLKKISVEEVFNLIMDKINSPIEERVNK